MSARDEQVAAIYLNRRGPYKRPRPVLLALVILAAIAAMFALLASL